MKAGDYSSQQSRAMVVSGSAKPESIGHKAHVLLTIQSRTEGHRIGGNWATLGINNSRPAAGGPIGAGKEPERQKAPRRPSMDHCQRDKNTAPSVS